MWQYKQPFGISLVTAFEADFLPVARKFSQRKFHVCLMNLCTINKTGCVLFAGMGGKDFQPNPGAFPANKTPESYVVGNQRPIRRNPLIARTLYYSKDMESFAIGLKRIKDACDKAGCRVEFQTPDDGFVVVLYRHGTQKLSGTAQKNAQKEETTAQKTAPDKPRSKNQKFYSV